MKSPHEMTSEQAIHWLKKTGASIATFVANDGNMNTQRGYDLLDRYNELRSDVYFRPDGSWRRYCNDVDADESHDGYDLFA